MTAEEVKDFILTPDQPQAKGFFQLYCECFGNRHVDYNGYQVWCKACGKPIFR